MNAQSRAASQWAYQKKLVKIATLTEQATNYSYPAGQAQAGIQMATVEVPWLLGYIEELKEELNGRQAVELSA